MDKKIDENVETTITNKETLNEYDSDIIQSYLKEILVMDVIICDTNNFVSTCETSSSYEKIELLLESKPEQVLSLLLNNNKFKYILNKCLDISVQIDLMNIFSKIQFLKLFQTKMIVLDLICNSKYLEHLNHSLMDVFKLKDSISGIKLLELFLNCETILEFIVEPKPKKLLNEIMQSIQSIMNDSNSEDINELLIINNNLDTEQIIQGFKHFKISNSVQYDVKKWPRCFKKLSVYPVISDITAIKVVLSPKIMKGSYDNVKHYLDVQFRLLREDFIAPLREGIQFYKATKENNQTIKKIPNMHIYLGVKINKKVKDKKVSYFVNFYTNQDCSYDSKRFMFESLLVFSNDNFNSIFFAQVIQMKRNVSPFKKLKIKFFENNVTIKLNSFYIMAESDAYFLPYMYAMDVLQSFSCERFPMKSYIVYGKSVSKVPAYLTYCSKIYNINGLRFDILNDDLWPDNKFLELDCAQWKAYKSALTEEFTIIQGPPGTGKTYIGLRIARTIIENMYETNLLKNPIVVVCYTNHALDQFLEGLFQITEKIIRIGSGCKSDVLKSCRMRGLTLSSFEQLSKSYVVGLTTTGAAMKHSLLLDLKPPIVIIEEAAEVLESYVVTSLTEFCQHVILIGDHKQLRPRNASFTLSKKFNLDVSLFERMVKNGYPCYTLTTQHRMRPEISSLMKPIYPFLMDHESVKNRSNIRGVSKNVYFIHHEMHEDKVIGSNSHRNTHEINFFMKFVRYLFSQGYSQDQVTILVTYREQLLELQKIREKSSYLEDFRIECVDGYQGEENDIILLSLVRNNLENDIGFLNIQNRVCVALSRARDGLYIMGNMDNLIHSSMWSEISQQLFDQQCLGNKLTLHCEIHKDWTSTVCNSGDFDKIQCSKVCDIKMDCGHHCPHLCHYFDQSHETLYRCKKSFKRTLSCGFKIKIECWMRFLTFKCPKLRSQRYGNLPIISN